MEDDEDRGDEEQHRRQRVPGAQLEQEILARERADVADVAHVASASRAGRQRLDARGIVGRDEEGALPAKLVELRVEELGAGLVERAVRLVEHEQLRLVEEDAAESETLGHAARVRGDPLVPRLPEPEALEQHPDPLPPLGDPIEASVELEVLERRQLAVDERLMAEVADLRPRRAAFDRSLGRPGEAGADPQQGRLPGAVRPGDDEKAAARQREVDPPQDAFLPVALAEPAGREHASSIGRPPRFTAVLQRHCSEPCPAEALFELRPERSSR